MSSATSTSNSNNNIMSNKTLQKAALLSLKLDKPILLNYYEESKSKSCKLAKIEDNETILYKSKEEYTSPIEKIYQVGEDNSGDMICVTENSIYVVTKNILPKK